MPPSSDRSEASLRRERHRLLAEERRHRGSSHDRAKLRDRAIALLGQTTDLTAQELVSLRTIDFVPKPDHGVVQVERARAVQLV